MTKEKKEHDDELLDETAQQETTQETPLRKRTKKSQKNTQESVHDAKAHKVPTPPKKANITENETTEDEGSEEKTPEKRPRIRRIASGYIRANSLQDFVEQLKERLFGDDAPNMDLQAITVNGMPFPPPDDEEDNNAKEKSFMEDKQEETIKEHRRRMMKEQQQKDLSALEKIKNFNYTPKQIRDYLNRFVVSQDEAKKVLAIAICDHYNHVRRCLENPQKMANPYAKHNVLMIGSTGVGKTYLMRCLSNMLGVPFVKADATKYSETGYVGYDVDDIIRDLIKVADGNVKLAQFGIVYIDEIDKIAAKSSDGGKDVSGRGVQINLLKLMEDSEIKVLSQSEMMNPMAQMMMRRDQPTTIHTKNILFIVSGAFDKICDIIRKRLGTTQIGFGASAVPQLTAQDDELLKQIQTQDLVKYGFEPEFVGRLPVRVALSDLDASHLASILSSAENNVLQQYVEAFAGYGITLNVLPEAIEEISRMAVAEKTGARGLLTILEHIFRDFKFELPGSGIKELTISASTVHNPRGTLELLLSQK